MPGLGEEATAQDMPSHRSVNVPLSVRPTAQQSDGEVHVTPVRKFNCPGLGEVTIVQDVPSQRSIKVSTLLLVVYSPTAQHCEAEVHVTPQSSA